MTKLLSLLTVLSFLFVGIQCQFDGDDMDVFVPDLEDGNFGNFVGRDKQSIILFYYENNCLDCYNFRVEFNKFYQMYGDQLSNDFNIGTVDLFRNTALKRRYSSFVKNEFPVIIYFKPYHITDPIIYDGPMNAEKFFAWAQGMNTNNNNQ